MADTAAFCALDALSVIGIYFSDNKIYVGGGPLNMHADECCRKPFQSDPACIFCLDSI